MRALEFYCGAGGATWGLQQAGFRVVGVDIESQPRYCGDAFVQANALEYLRTADLSQFDFIHASPPCPRFTALKTAPNAKGAAHPDLITPTRELLRVTGLPYVIENVEGAKKYLIDPVMLCGTSFGLETPPYYTAPDGFELQRHRLFEVSGFPVSAPPCRHSGRPVIGIYGGHARDRRRELGKNHRSGSNLPLEFAFTAMGVPLGSMTLTSLCDGIPPAYSRFIAEAFLKTRERMRRHAEREEPRFSDDEEQSPLLTEKELRDACLYAAAIIVVAFSLGCEFEDCTLDDDGAVWPTSTTRIEIKYPEEWRWKYGIFPAVGAIHEAGTVAVTKQHDHGPCRINNSQTPQLLDDPTIWAAVKALARFIQDNDEDHGNYGALGTACHEPGDEDSYAIELMKSMGVHPGYGWKIMRPDDNDEDDE